MSAVQRLKHALDHFMPKTRHAMAGIIGVVLASGMAVDSFAAPVQTIRHTVAATDGKHCQAYFHNVSGRIRWPLLLSLKGTGIYSTARTAQLELAARALYAQGRLTVLTLDKPGIALTPAQTVAVEDGVYNRYTQEDLVQCAANALSLAAKEMAPTSPPGQVLLSGHSEGAQVAIRLLTKLTSEGHPLATHVDSLFLSGLPLGDWRALLGAQLNASQRQSFFLAFARRDDATLRRFGGLSAAYLGNIFAQETLEQTLSRLAALGTRAHLHIYQGLADRNTPAAPVRDLVARAQQAGALRIDARYYPTGHALNRAAALDIARDIERGLDRHLAALTSSDERPAPQGETQP